ncbi:MAG: hypothetical protein KC482_01025 [Dehalococcoidia bacterium]|nr:hypothetical protein [Dehalococcoidia bacterium]MCA9824399.1 hypothetical protein [Dehalococcoidia bacterium]MCA9845976.1 hypothetical protein [Dehalococcoidia bacterium]MCA9852179.1 hypothetical protein [Dehalococcoidia bacterium]
MPVTREGIHAALEPVRPDIARLVPDRQMTRIVPVECPGLSRYSIWQLTHLHPHKPIVHYLGFAEDSEIFVLSERPDQFVAMVDADGDVSIDSEAAAASFLRAYLVSTRRLTRLTYLVESVDDMKFRPKLDDAEAKERDRVRQEYAGTIVPLAAVKDGDGYRVEAYQVQEQDLVKITATVSTAGAIETDSAVLESNLPLVYGA